MRAAKLDQVNYYVPDFAALTERADRPGRRSVVSTRTSIRQAQRESWLMATVVVAFSECGAA
ncbi:MAG: hypothetical protein ABSD97_04115 [Acidimicrobiales bacterium]